MSPIIWALEIVIDPKEGWQIMCADNTFGASSPLRGNLRWWKETRPGFPWRIKAYVRHERRSRSGLFYVTGKHQPAKYDLEEIGEEL